MGFKAINGGGLWVKAGLGQFANLYKTMPERYAYHENKEEEFREFIEKDVSILRDRRNNTTKPLTMRELRERVDAGESFAYDSDWSCMCFVVIEDEWL